MKFTRANKYGNKRVKEDNITFDSLRELKRYRELKILQKAGRIRDLEVHRRFPLEVSGQLICSYEADFTYMTGHEVATYKFIVEDCKGVITSIYRVKKKLMKACLGINILES